MIRRIFLIPTRAQWHAWTLPSKVGLVGLYVSIIGLLPTIYQWTSAPRSAEKIVAELEEQNSKRNWVAMAETLSTIEARPDLAEEYGFFKGRLCVYNPTCLEGPVFYFSKVGAGSKYFQRAAISMINHARRKHQLTHQAGALQSELRGIADGFIRPRAIVPLYYFAKLMGTDDSDFVSINALYTDFTNRYESVVDFTHFPLAAYSGDGGIARLDWTFDTLAVLALFQAKLAFSAHNAGRADVKVRSILAWNVIAREKNGEALIEGANKNFPPQSTKIVIQSGRSDISRKFAEWTYPSLFEELDKFVAAIGDPNEQRRFSAN